MKRLTQVVQLCGAFVTFDFPVQKAHRCIFSLTNYLPNQELDSEMIDILHRNYDELLFWPQCYDDLSYLYSITDCPVQIITPNLDCFDEILNGGDIDYVGNRLHGGIYALQHNVRSLIISIDYRARNMHKTYGIPCIERDLINDQLEELINSDSNISINGINRERIFEWKRQFGE